MKPNDPFALHDFPCNVIHSRGCKRISFQPNCDQKVRQDFQRSSCLHVNDSLDYTSIFSIGNVSERYDTFQDFLFLAPRGSRWSTCATSFCRRWKKKKNNEREIMLIVTIPFDRNQRLIIVKLITSWGFC